MQEMQARDRNGFVKAMYARVFFPGSGGDYETAHGLDNVVLGLSREYLDDSTEQAVILSDEGISLG